MRALLSPLRARELDGLIRSHAPLRVDFPRLHHAVLDPPLEPRHRSRCWTRFGPSSIISPPSPRGRRSIRCRNVTPTSTGSCGASRSHGAPARCGRPIWLARDHPDTGAPGRIRSRRAGPGSSSGWRPSRIGPRRSSSTVSAGNSPGCSSPASFGPLQRRVRDWRRLAARRLLFADPTTSPQDARSDSTGRLPRRRPSRTPRITGPGSEPRNGRHGYDLSEASR